jgi:hypothetical protein
MQFTYEREGNDCWPLTDTLKEYVANPLNFYKENLISKKGE